MTSAAGPDYVLRGHESAVNCIAFSSSAGEEGALLSGSVDGDVKVWQLSSRRASTRSAAHSNSVTTVLPDPTSSGKRFITAGRDECIKIWNIETFASTSEPVTVLHTGAQNFCNVSTCVDGSDICRNAVITASADEHRALLWDLRTGGVVHAIDVDKRRGMITALHLNSSAAQEQTRAHVLVGLEDGSLAAVDLRAARQVGAVATSAEQQVEYVPLHDKQPIMAMDVSPDGKTLLTAGADARIVFTAADSSAAAGVFDAAPTPCLVHIPEKTITLPSSGTSSVKYRTDGRIVVSAHWDNTVRIFDAKKAMRPLAVLTHHRQSIFADATIALWSVYGPSSKPAPHTSGAGAGTGAGAGAGAGRKKEEY